MILITEGIIRTTAFIEISLMGRERISTVLFDCPEISKVIQLSLWGALFSVEGCSSIEDSSHDPSISFLLHRNQ